MVFSLRRAGFPILVSFCLALAGHARRVANIFDRLHSAESQGIGESARKALSQLLMVDGGSHAFHSAGSGSRGPAHIQRGHSAMSATAEDVPSIIVGGGRIGSLLVDLGIEGDALVKRGEPIPSTPATGPIYVCTRNDALAGIIEATPPDRRADLVFLQNGMLGDFLQEKGLPDASQVLVYLAVAKLGEKPTDGITDANPEGLTSATGKWASAFKARLANGDLTCHVKQGEAYTKAMLEKHIWICAFMLVGALNGGVTVGEVESTHSDQLRAVVDQLAAAGAKELGVSLDDGVFERLTAYGRAVSHFPTAVKEFEWRNGWFYKISEAALARGEADPMPLHTEGLKKLSVIS